MKLHQLWLYCKIAFSCVAFVTAACNSNNSAKTSAKEASILSGASSIFDKMVGTWKNADGKSFERWTKNPDGTFQSKVFSIKDTDTSYTEEAIIYQENNNWVFENRVTNQNNGKAVKFTSTLLSDSSVQFSNPAHDFPTDVNYRIIDSINLKAFIIGPSSSGGKDTFYFQLSKVEIGRGQR